MAQTPAGWYVDPGNPTSLRYWNGTQWTQHVHDLEQPSASAPGQQYPDAGYDLKQATTRSLENNQVHRRRVIDHVIASSGFADRDGVPHLGVVKASDRRTTVGFVGGYPDDGDAQLCELADRIREHELEACVSGWGEPVLLVREAIPARPDNAWLRYTVFGFLIVFTLTLFSVPLAEPRAAITFEFPDKSLGQQVFIVGVFGLYSVGSLMVYLTFYRRIQAEAQSARGLAAAALLAALWSLIYWRMAIVYLYGTSDAVGDPTDGPYQLWRWAVLDSIPFVDVDRLLLLDRPLSNEGLTVALILIAIQVTIIFAVVAVIRAAVRSESEKRRKEPPWDSGMAINTSALAAWLTPPPADSSGSDQAPEYLRCPGCHSMVPKTEQTCFQCGLDRGRVAIPIVDTPLWARVGGFLLVVAPGVAAGMLALLFLSEGVLGATTDLVTGAEIVGGLVVVGALLAIPVAYLYVRAPTVSYRRRDSLLGLIPVYGVFLLGMVAWRRTALPTRYWPARLDESQAATIAATAQNVESPGTARAEALKRSKTGPVFQAVAGYILAIPGAYLVLTFLILAERPGLTG